MYLSRRDTVLSCIDLAKTAWRNKQGCSACVRSAMQCLLYKIRPQLLDVLTECRHTLYVVVTDLERAFKFERHTTCSFIYSW